MVWIPDINVRNNSGEGYVDIGQELAQLLVLLVKMCLGEMRPFWSSRAALTESSITSVTPDTLRRRKSNRP